MKKLYTVTNCIIRSGVVTHQGFPWPCRLRFYRFQSLTNTSAMVKLSSRLIVTDCRSLLNKVEMSSQVNSCDSEINSPNCDEAVTKSSDPGIRSALEPSDSLEGQPHLTEMDVSGIVPALPKKSFNLAAYVNDSVTLSNLVRLGVNLSKIEERYMSLAEQLLKLDFDHDVKPVLLLLHQCDVKECDIGECITRNPHVLCEPIDDMQVRINYLESKRFSKESIARIVSKEPRVLTNTTKQTDTQLGYLQKTFMLSGTCYYLLSVPWYSGENIAMSLSWCVVVSVHVCVFVGELSPNP